MDCGCTSITLKGGTGVDPIDITELYDANKYNDWGCVDTADGLTYDIEPDGIGLSPVDVKLLSAMVEL